MDYYKKAVKLHNDNTVIDAHLDLGGIIFERKRKGEKKIIEHLFLDDFKKAGFNFIVGAIYVDDVFLPELALRVALDQVVELTEEVESCEDLMLVTSKKDLKKALENNKIGILISLEGVEPILKDINLLTVFYKMGVRGLGLTWSRRNFAADGSYFGNVEEGIRGGLTPFGIELVKKAEEMGMFIDVSHLNDEGFEDVVKYSEKPFMASHSNSRTINNMTRNLKDEQMKIIGERKGVIGINAYKGIVSQNKEEQTISKLCDHIEKMIKEAGEDAVCYGFDLCDLFLNSQGQNDTLKDHKESLKVTEELLRRGYSENTLKKIIGGNLFNYYGSVLK
jgi:membrane dipeptidase